MKKVELAHVNTWKENHPSWCTMQEILVQRLPDGAGTENHYHDFHEYYIVLSGHADIIMDHQRFVLDKGDIAAIYCGSRHHLENATDNFAYVALRDAPMGQKRPGRILDPTVREFVGMQGRYIDGPVLEYEIPKGRCAIVPPRTWFWLKQKPDWSYLTSIGCMEFLKGTDEPDYHKHECDEMYLCTSGHMTALVDGVSYEMYEGDIIMMPAGTFHRVTLAHVDSQLTYFYGELGGLHRYGHLEDGRDEWVL